MPKLFFPKGFLWGSAGSAYQTEGGNTNTDWWQWEHSAGRATDLTAHGKNPAAYFSGNACDSYHRYEEDFDIAAELNMNSQRISVEWSRIEPKKGEFDLKEIEHYRHVLGALRERGMATFVTLHHFTLPIWFAALGGFEKAQNVAHFESYSAEVAEKLGDLIDFITPINEPNAYATYAYIQGDYPPQKKNVRLALHVVDNLIAAHRASYTAIKKIRPNVQVGSAYPFTSNRFSWFLKPFAPRLLSVNYRFIDQVADRSDFIGVHYYFSNAIRATWRRPFVYAAYERGPFTDFGWEIYPEGIYDALVLCKERYPKLPVYVLENGIADAGDKLRASYIHDHLVNVHRALSEGVDVRGYMYWSLLDNFEWVEGYQMKFGLVEVDREQGLERRVRPSARYYAQICKSNSIDV